MRIGIPVVVALALVAAQPAGAATRPGVPIVPGVEVVHTPCPGDTHGTRPDGCTFPDRHVIYVTDNDPTTLYHELGHQFATWVLGDTNPEMAGGMRKFARITRPIGSGARSAFDVREQFADAYAMCAIGPTPQPGEWGDRGDNYPTAYGYDPTPRAYRAVCGLIDRAGARRGLAVAA